MCQVRLLNIKKHKREAEQLPFCLYYKDLDSTTEVTKGD